MGMIPTVAFDLSVAMLDAKKWKNSFKILRKITLNLVFEHKIISCQKEDEINTYCK